MARPLEEAVALVTGGGRGIGAGICVELVRQGARVMVNDIDDGPTTQGTLADLAEAGGEARFYGGSAGKVQDVQAMVEATVQAFGRIDLLVTNAGDARYEEADQITEETWDDHLDLHLKGPFFAAQAAARHMRRQGHGKSVNIASEQAVIGYSVLTHYTAAKAGLLTLTRSLALSWAPTVLVNAVCPWPTDTAPGSERWKCDAIARPRLLGRATIQRAASERKDAAWRRRKGTRTTGSKRQRISRFGQREAELARGITARAEREICTGGWVRT